MLYSTKRICAYAGYLEVNGCRLEVQRNVSPQKELFCNGIFEATPCRFIACTCLWSKSLSSP
ncbi:hypothetical protein T4E_6569 [Trichinella pseudospiralis]|uniref:Uncharacterized protein n=1 Tax=Trichinella pseudospiralis TaxID=6337 RepID=A0A0V0Y8I4_TRIPS|nr:hypothetical protein T4E_6569 [Trichinella pseudospiralis]